MTVVDDTDDRLDRLLAAWAGQQRLGERQADAMLHAITSQTRESLPATWWSDLSVQISAAVVLATALPGRAPGMADTASAA
jgi:hypothetical protein